MQLIGRLLQFTKPHLLQLSAIMMPHSPSSKGQNGFGAGEGGPAKKRSSISEQRHGTKLGTVSGVYVPVFLSIMSILMFLRFGLILGQIGFVGMLGLTKQPICIVALCS